MGTSWPTLMEAGDAVGGDDAGRGDHLRAGRRFPGRSAWPATGGCADQQPGGELKPLPAALPSKVRATCWRGPGGDPDAPDVLLSPACRYAATPLAERAGQVHFVDLARRSAPAAAACPAAAAGSRSAPTPAGVPCISSVLSNGLGMTCGMRWLDCCPVPRRSPDTVRSGPRDRSRPAGGRAAAAMPRCRGAEVGWYRECRMPG